MQTSSLYWYLVYIKSVWKRRAATPDNQRAKMSKTATVALSPTPTLFGRLLAMIDRVLMTNAQIAIRNGDVPRIGL
jgi:hypothetical protein